MRRPREEKNILVRVYYVITLAVQVVYEAAAALVNLRHTTARQIAPAVSVLQLFCSYSKPALRFAAVRTLNKVNIFIIVFV